MINSNDQFIALVRRCANIDFSVNLPRFLRVFGLVLMAVLAAPNTALAREHDHSTMDHAEQTPPNGPPIVKPVFSKDKAIVTEELRDQGLDGTPKLPFDAVDKPQDGPADHSGHEMSEREPFIIIDDSPPTFGEGSGTARLPGFEGGHFVSHGLMFEPGNNWMLMLHGYATGVYTNQSGPRGDDKAYVQSMAMLSAEKDTNWGRVQLKTMMSLEPLMKNRGYPNLFATGETAGGEPLVDRQHPHDLFMELAARVDFNVGDTSSVFVYGGPVGEPALGPSAFMHRGSAKLNPEAPITHHWFDSNHITYGVGTVGFASSKVQIEGSIFTGREPDERRWNIEKPRFDSWSVRATWNPSSNWALQASTGRLKTPEFFIHPDEDEQRSTASVHYANGDLSAMLAFSAKDRKPGPTLTAWLAEVNWNLDDHHTLFGRAENVRNDELFPDDLNPLHEVPFRISKFQLGYAYRLPLTGVFNLAFGGTVSAFGKPDALDAAYGDKPMGYTLFARLSLGL